MNLISLVWSQVAKTTVKKWYIKVRFAHLKSDDDEGDDLSNGEDWICSEQRHL